MGTPEEVLPRVKVRGADTGCSLEPGSGGPLRGGLHGDEVLGVCCRRSRRREGRRGGGRRVRGGLVLRWRGTSAGVSGRQLQFTCTRVCECVGECVSVRAQCVHVCARLCAPVFLTVCRVAQGVAMVTHLGHCFKHGDQDKLDEPDLGRGFGHFVPVHERGHGKAFRLLAVALGRAADTTLKKRAGNLGGSGDHCSSRKRNMS